MSTWKSITISLVATLALFITTMQIGLSDDFFMAIFTITLITFFLVLVLVLKILFKNN
jgi:hypothetical protein